MLAEVIVSPTPVLNKLVVPDGISFNEQIDEFEVWLDGEIVNYAFHQSTAYHQYHEALRLRREHAERCPEDDIPWQGEPVQPPSAGREFEQYGIGV